jgi:hypothetical protein
MRLTLACVVGIITALLIPVIGQYLAMVIVLIAVLPMGIIVQDFGHLISEVARNHGWSETYLTVGLVAGPIACFGLCCLIKAAWSRDSGIGALGIASLGSLAITALALFQLGPGFHH